MADLVVMGGQAGGFSGGVQTVGRAPAMVSGGSVSSNQLHNHLHWTLPADDALATVAIYRGTYNGTSQGTFPGGSPLEVVGRSSNWNDHSASSLTTAYEYWAVTFDKYGNPYPVTSANAVYLGHA